MDNLVTNDEKQVYEGHPGGTILIVVDTLRADVLNAYAPNNPLGGNLRKTPNIDALIAKGLLFKNLYAQASWTRPAVASIMTGKLSSQHGVMSKTSILGLKHQTMAELFHEKGYKTLGIGNNANLTASYGFSQGFDNYHYLSVNRYFWAPRGSENLSGYNMMRLVIERYSPFDIHLTTENLHGWPRMILRIWKLGDTCKEDILSYGVAILPNLKGSSFPSVLTRFFSKNFGKTLGNKNNEFLFLS